MGETGASKINVHEDDNQFKTKNELHWRIFKLLRKAITQNKEFDFKAMQREIFEFLFYQVRGM